MNSQKNWENFGWKGRTRERKQRATKASNRKPISRESARKIEIIGLERLKAAFERILNDARGRGTSNRRKRLSSDDFWVGETREKASRAHSDDL